MRTAAVSIQRSDSASSCPARPRKTRRLSANAQPKLLRSSRNFGSTTSPSNSSASTKSTANANSKRLAARAFSSPQRYSGTANWVRWFAARKKFVNGIRATPYSSSGRFCGRNTRTRLQKASRNTAPTRSGSPCRTRVNSCSIAATSYRLQKAASTASTTMHPMMAGEAKVREAVLLLRYCMGANRSVSAQISCNAGTNKKFVSTL